MVTLGIDWRQRLYELRWTNYQGDRDEIGVSWDSTDTNEPEWTLFDTINDGMVLSRPNHDHDHDDDDEWVPNGDVWMFWNDEMNGHS